MNVMEKKPLAILNLTGKLCPELEQYFVTRKIKVVDPLLSDESLPWTHIITKDRHDFNLIHDSYNTVENDIKIISLTSVIDLQNFIIANGKFVLDEVWMK